MREPKAHICLLILAISLLPFSPEIAFADTAEEQPTETIAEAKILYDLGDYEGALILLDEYLLNYPASAEALNLKGATLWKMGAFKEAEKSFLSATAADPDFVEGFRNLGHLYLEEGRYHLAKDFFGEAARLKPDEYELWYYLGYSCYHMGEYQEAIEHLQEAIAIQPENFNPWHLQAKAFAELGSYQQALDCWHFVCNLHPSRWEPWFGSAEVLALLGEEELALDHLQKALQLFPTLGWRADELDAFAPYAQNSRFREMVDGAKGIGAKNPGD